MQFDTKGRLWVAAWPTYPKWEPLKEMNDALVILHDDNNDGSADRATEFARVQNPLGFEFWNGGVLVTRQSEILFLKDTDGDDKADVQTIMLTGLDSSDSHHGANNLIYGPDGGLYWQSGVFMQHNHEHPWGPSKCAPRATGSRCMNSSRRKCAPSPPVKSSAAPTSPTPCRETSSSATSSASSA